MLYLLFEEQFNAGESSSIQRTTVRPLDGKSEGKGLAISVRHGENNVDVTLNYEEAQEFIGWCSEKLKYENPTEGLTTNKISDTKKSNERGNHN